MFKNVFCIWIYLRLRNGKTLVKMVCLRNNPLPQNNALENEQLVSSTVGMEENTNLIGINQPVLDPLASTKPMLGVVVVCLQQQVSRLRQGQQVFPCWTLGLRTYQIS